MTKQVYDGPYCACHVYKHRGGDVEIVADGCPVHSPNTEADALVRALPLKAEHDRWREYEAQAEALTTPQRQIFTHDPLDTPEVRAMYGGRYGR